MPPATRRRDATARCIMNVLSEDHDNGNNAVPVEPEWDKNHLTLVLQDLQESLQNRLTILKSQSSKAKDNQKQCWGIATVKIRKAIKEMTVREFNAAHGCDLLHLLQQPNSSKKRVYDALATPAPSKQPSSMLTVTRTVKRGEAML